MRPMVIFDGDCAFCTTSARWLERVLAADVGVEPWQFIDLAAYEVDAERASYEVLLVDSHGRVHGGAQAVARWLIHSGGVWRFAGTVMTRPPVRWIAAGVYRLIAANRHRLPGGTPACALRPPQPPDAA